MGADEWERWGSALPLPSYKRTLTSHTGLKIQVAYELKYQTQKSGDWYFIADLQRSYQSIIKGIMLNDNIIIDGEGWDSNGIAYTLQDLKIFPTDERSYPVIMRWATTKKTFRSKAFIYAKRLKYEGLLSCASMMGAVTAMNSKMKKTEQHKTRTLERLTNDILAQSDEWAVKLSKEALHYVRSDLGVHRGKQLKEEKQDRINQIKQAVNSGDFVKPNGEINKSKLADYLRIDRRTVFNLLPLLVGVMVMLLWVKTTYTLPLFCKAYNISGMAAPPHPPFSKVYFPTF